MIERPDDLTAEWLTASLGAGRVSRFTVERIGTGQMSECYRVALSYSRGQRPGVGRAQGRRQRSDESADRPGAGTLRARGAVLLRGGARASAGPIAHCYHASYQPETGIFTLLLDDAAPAEVGDEIRGATIADAILALTQLGRLHAPLIGSEALAEANGSIGRPR